MSSHYSVSCRGLWLSGAQCCIATKYLLSESDDAFLLVLWWEGQYRCVQNSGQCLNMTVGLNFGPNLADKWVGPMFVLSSPVVLSLKAGQI